MSDKISWVSAVITTLTTIGISAVGGFLASLLQLPAAWLMGGALAVAVAALLGVKVGMPNWLRDATFVLTGVSMGANVARDSLALMVQWPVTLAALVVELILIVAGTGYLLRKLLWVDRGTAYLSSFPGHLSFIMGIAAAGVGDSRQITIIQVIRILLLTTVVPIGALFLPVGHVEGPQAGPLIPWPTLILVTVACAAVGFVFTKLRVPAAYALGAMAASMIAKFAGWFDGSIPPHLLVLAFVLVGALIGSRFGGISFTEFRKAAIGGFLGT